MPSDPWQPEQPAAPAWPPDMYDMSALCHALSIAPRTAARLLSAGRLPPADANLGNGGPKGRRWDRERLLAFVRGGGRHA